jgi:zinc protease
MTRSALLSAIIVLSTALIGVANAAQAENTFKLPPCQKVVLDNGLTVYLMEQHDVPLVYVSLAFPAGAINDGPRYGLASLTAESLLFGAGNLTKTQMEERLDFIGASYGAGASKDSAQLFLSFVNADRKTVLPILKDIVCHPTFDANEIDKRKKQLLVELQQDKESPADVIQSYFHRFLFQDNVYGNPVSGIPSSVSSFTDKDVKAFYQAHYLPSGSVLAVVGDFDTPAMQQEITALFRDWKTTGTVPSVTAPPASGIAKSRVLLVNKDDATETQFIIGGPGVPRNNPDYVEIQVVNTILGGRFTSWLNDELRINRGLTYGARSGFGMYKRAGTFVISTYTKTESTEEAITVAMDVLNRLHKQGIDETTLTSAKNYVNGQFPPRYETGGSLAGLLTDMYVYGFDESFINDFQKRVQGMTVEKAKQIVAKYFPKDNLQYVLIGKASEIRKAATRLGEVTEKEIKSEGF